MRPNHALAPGSWLVLSVAAYALATSSTYPGAPAAALALLFVLPGGAATAGVPGLSVAERFLAMVGISTLAAIAVVGALLVVELPLERGSVLLGLLTAVVVCALGGRAAIGDRTPTGLATDAAIAGGAAVLCLAIVEMLAHVAP